jgi:hypothetical protein
MARTPGDRPNSAAEFAKLLDAATAVAPLSPGKPAQQPAWLPNAALVGAGVLLLVVGVLVWRRDSGHDENARRIAVLPFENAGSADDEYFADGMTDEVRSKLAAIPGLQVTARASTSSYKKSSKTTS